LFQFINFTPFALDFVTWLNYNTESKG